MRKSKYSDLPPGSPPSLSPELTSIYNSLDNNNRVIFVKVFKFLWGVVCPMSRFVKYGGVLHSYWVVDILKHKYNIDSSELSLLSYLYHVTDKGRKFINSKFIYSGPLLPGVIQGTKCRIINDLKRRGFILRSWSDPDNPYYKISFASRPVFIRLSPSGVRLIESIEKDLHNILMRTSMDELTGTANKKT